MQNKILISLIGVIVAITILVIGILIGKKSSNNTAVTSDNTQESFQAGYDAAKAKCNQVYSQILVPTNSTEGVIGGVIQEIDGNKIKIAVKSNEPLTDDSSVKFKTITVTDNTKITIKVAEDPEEIKKKMEEKSFDPATLLLLSTYKDASLTDLKINQFIMASVPAGSENQSEFIATEIKADRAPFETAPAESDLTSQK